MSEKKEIEKNSIFLRTFLLVSISSAGPCTIFALYELIKYNQVIYGHKNPLMIAIAVSILFSFVVAAIISQDIINPIKVLIKNIKMYRTNKKINPFDLPNLYSEFSYLVEEYSCLIKEVESFQKKAEENAKLAAIGQTTQMLAHDIRKPFTSMKSMLSMIDKLKKDPKALEKAKTTVDHTIIHVEKMISDILDFSREMKLETKPEPIASLLDFSIRQTIQIYKDININFEYQLRNTKQALLDDERIARVFANIIGNGIEALKSNQKSAVSYQQEKLKDTCSTSYKPQATSSICFNTRDVRKKDNDFVEITIGNNGPKFKEEDIAHLFDSFFTKGKKSGTGLGLASAHKIVTLHGGTIEARNTKYEIRNTECKTGVEFVITIPASKKTEKHNQDLLPKNTNEILFVKYEPLEEYLDKKLNFLSTHDKIKVVLLEDETLYRAFVRNAIETDETLSKLIILYDADKVDECIELVKKENIEYAIVDIDLNEDKNGYDFLEEVSKQKLKLSSLVHSNRYLDEEIQRAYDLGAKAYASKPLSTDQLIDFIYEGLNEADFEKAKQHIKKPKIKKEELNIFIVDDNFITGNYIQSLLKDILIDHSCSIFIFTSPGKALSELEIKKPDIVISDNHLGTESMLGEDLLKLLREENDKTLLYLSSDTDSESLLEKASKCKATGSFSPDINKTDLEQVILKDIQNYLKKRSSSISKQGRESISKYMHDINKPILNTALTCKLLLNNKETIKEAEVYKKLNEIEATYKRYKEVYEENKALFTEYDEILNDDIKKHYEAQLDYISDLLSHENPSILFNKDN
ncbi:MAG: response regulator, partial [Pseudomonadota bacterium]